MDPFSAMLLGAGVSALGNVISGIIGANASAEDRKKAQEAIDKALNELEKTPLPPELAKNYLFKSILDAGVYSPTLVEFSKLPVSELTKINPNDYFKADLSKNIYNDSLNREDYFDLYDSENLKQSYEQQREKLKSILDENKLLENLKKEPNQETLDVLKENLNELQRLSRQGLSPIEKAQIEEERLKNLAINEANRKKILSEMQQRGISGSGVDLISQLVSGEQGEKNLFENTNKLIMLSNQRALDALSGANELALRLQNEEQERNRELAESQFRIAQTLANMDSELMQNMERNAAELNRAKAAALQNLMEKRADATNFLKRLEMEQNKDIVAMLTEQARAQDRINQFNIENINRQNEINTNLKNQAMIDAIQAKRKDIENQLNYQANLAELKNKEWQNIVDLNRAKAAAHTGSIPFYQENARNTATNIQKIGSGLSDTAGNLITAYNLGLLKNKPTNQQELTNR